MRAPAAGLRVDPSNSALQSGLNDTLSAKNRGGAGGGGLFGPDAMARLVMDPRGRPLLEDAEFMGRLKAVGAHPEMLQTMMGDSKMQLVRRSPLQRAHRQQAAGVQAVVKGAAPPTHTHTRMRTRAHAPQALDIMLGLRMASSADEVAGMMGKGRGSASGEDEAAGSGRPQAGGSGAAASEAAATATAQVRCGGARWAFCFGTGVRSTLRRIACRGNPHGMQGALLTARGGAPAAQADDTEMEPAAEEDRELARKKEAAAAEKAKGNEAYKAKRFEEALTHYDAAIAADDSDISFLTNKWAARRRARGVRAAARAPSTALGAHPARCPSLPPQQGRGALRDGRLRGRREGVRRRGGARPRAARRLRPHRPRAAAQGQRARQAGAPAGGAPRARRPTAAHLPLAALRHSAAAQPLNPPPNTPPGCGGIQPLPHGAPQRGHAQAAAGDGEGPQGGAGALGLGLLAVQ